MTESIKNDYPSDQAEHLVAALPERAKKLCEAVIFQPLFKDLQVMAATV